MGSSLIAFLSQLHLSLIDINLFFLNNLLTFCPMSSFENKNSFIRSQVAGGYISHYLLERARVVSQSSDERNYHIFYQLCAGAPEKLREQLQLAPPSAFHYLNRGCTRYFCSKDNDAAVPANRKSKDHLAKGSLKDPLIDDVKNFQIVDQVLDHWHSICCRLK